MPAYVVIEVDVKDPAAYAKYMEAANGTHAPFGGRFVARGGRIHPLEGDWDPSRFVLIEFPSVEAAYGWYRSPAYQAARRLRLGAAEFKGFIVEGLPPTASAVAPHPVNLEEKFSKFQDLWSPKRVATVDEYDVKIVKVHGEFTEHVHEAEDELFLVLDGELHIAMPGQSTRIGPGEIIVVPKGIKHKPSAKTLTRLLLLEKRGVVNTGEVRNEQTKKVGDL